jgi:hypothetical protein
MCHLQNLLRAASRLYGKLKIIAILRWRLGWDQFKVPDTFAVLDRVPLHRITVCNNVCIAAHTAFIEVLILEVPDACIGSV